MRYHRIVGGAVVTSVVLASCMHAAMVGVGTPSHPSEGITIQGVLEKEVVVDNVRAVAVFPPLSEGKETLLTLKLSDFATNEPIAHAATYFHVFYRIIQDRGLEEGNGDSIAVDSFRLSEREDVQDVNIDYDVKETSEAGIYTVSYIPPQRGELTVMFHVTDISGTRLDKPITVEASCSVIPQ